jgi:hypothetical protein
MSLVYAIGRATFRRGEAERAGESLSLCSGACLARGLPAEQAAIPAVQYAYDMKPCSLFVFTVNGRRS